MKLPDQEILRRLGCGETIDSICKDADWARPQFHQWWTEVAESRIPEVDGTTIAAVSADVQIERDALGIPHIHASTDRDLFFGFGFALAQDRLFQLDYLRRKGQGRLSEILGEESVPLDTVARTVALNRIATNEWNRLSCQVQDLVEAFTLGVNALMERTGDNPPVEFDLLDYRPEPWKPTDCLVIESEFRWYLTGRLQVIAIPELAKRTLGEGSLYDEFLLGELDEESILHPGDYEPSTDSSASEPVGQVMNDPESAIGSNNWVVSGNRTTTTKPLLCSDPHIAFEAVSCWYEVHLCGGSFNVAGMGYVGIPAVMFGRNEKVAWGITNNICSQRDLYQENTDEEHPGYFEYDGNWEPQRSVVETIEVKGKDAVKKTIRFSRNGPIVDELLPEGTEQTGPVALKWLGSYQGGWLSAMLDMDRAESVAGFRESLRPWHVPTFAMVIADVSGSIGFHAAGRIPIRNRIERGYRNGWDPADQWQGLIPFESMPAITNPERGWIATANNRLAPDDFPFKLFGCWSSGWRAQRIRQLIEAHEKLSAQDVSNMQMDVKSLRAANLVPMLCQVLADETDERIQAASLLLQDWDFCTTSDSIAATIFNVFFTSWCHEVAKQRFDSTVSKLVAGAMAGCAGRLLHGDSINWFANGDRRAAVVNAFNQTLDLLTEQLGSNMQQWAWSNLHEMPLKHVLSGRGDCGDLLDSGGSGVRGDMVSVCNTGSSPDWKATTGGGYRLVADLDSQPPVLRAVDGQSQSGHPGSRHYGDQYETWLAGGYHDIPLDRKASRSVAVHRLTLEPG